MLKVRPELWIEWDFQKNDDLGFDIWKMTKGMDRDARWRCGRCNSGFDSRIYSRVNGTNCPYCAGQKVNHINSLASINPVLASEWHPTLNEYLTPNTVVCGKESKVWWLGTCGHEWEARIVDRNGRGDGCPYCANKKVLIGFNDAWTTNNELASLLENPDDGYKYTQSSHIKVNWKCKCGNTIRRKSLYRVNSRGLCCPKCSDGKSYPEKFIISLLNKLNIEFIHDSSFDWSQSRRYDFYISSLNLIIETHGAQHYDDKRTFTNRSLQSEINNDTQKRKLAKMNGIKYYVELDCSESNMTFIQNSINNSQLTELLNTAVIDFKEIHNEAVSSLIYEVCEYYKHNSHIEQNKLSKIFNVSDKTIREYLKIGNDLGICEYIPNSTRTKSNSVEHMRIKVVQLDLNGNLIKTHNSIDDAGKYLNKKWHSSISACCKGKAKTAFGYRWKYLKDYELMLENQNKIS